MDTDKKQAQEGLLGCWSRKTFAVFLVSPHPGPLPRWGRGGWLLNGFGYGGFCVFGLSVGAVARSEYLAFRMFGGKAVQERRTPRRFAFAMRFFSGKGDGAIAERPINFYETCYSAS